MKPLLLSLSTLAISFAVSSQVFHKDDMVEVDPSLSDTLKNYWKQASIVEYDSIGKKYQVKLLDGNKISIPSKSPEQWIRPLVNKQVVNKYGPGARIPYQKRNNALKPIRCNGSEAAIKRNITSQMASRYKDYSHISVEVTSFKAQNGYEDPKYKGHQVYPYKIEFLIHLKRSLVFAGNEYTEYQTWEFEGEYEYATRPGKSCELYSLPGSDLKLISKAWY